MVTAAAQSARKLVDVNEVVQYNNWIAQQATVFESSLLWDTTGKVDAETTAC